MKLCRYIVEFRRSSNIEGVFLLTDEEYESVKKMAGYEVRYGEISGKHSDVVVPLHPEHVNVITEDANDIEVFCRLFPEKKVGFDFKEYWFRTDLIYDEGYAEGSNTHSFEELWEGTQYYKFNLEWMRQAYLDGVNSARSD